MPLFRVTTYLTQHRAPTLKRPPDLDKHGFYSPHAWTPKQLASFASQLGGIDLGIVRAVKVLRDAGVETFESCQGGRGHAFPAATVRFGGGPSAGWKALSVCLSYGFPVRSLRRYWSVSPAGEPTGPEWEIVFREMP